MSEDLRIERALDVVSDVFVLFDRNFCVVYHNEANRAAMRAAGMDPDAAIGKHVLEALPQIADSVGHRESERAMRERVSTEWEESYSPDLRLRGRAYPTADGGLIVVASNITAEWQALEAARAAAEQEHSARSAAEEANRAKRDFLTAMSHELRTPLNAIGGYTELLAMGIRGPITDEQAEDLSRIAKNQLHLLTIVNDILNFARIEAGHVQFVADCVAVDGLLAALEPLVAPQIALKRISFSLAPCESMLSIHADPDKVQQILINLLGNAVKFTAPGGTIELCSRRDGSHVAIAVSDTGIGIPPERLEAIFEPFVQVHRSLSEHGTGTGLGLAISRDLARRMGGDVTVESRIGAGSTFTLRLPRSAP